MDTLTLDEIFIQKTFSLAKQCLNSPMPNPFVGALIVKDGFIIGEGLHRGPGTPHAEIDALNNCKIDPSGSTLYCNLEPCCHLEKRTPPCAQHLIKVGIKRVVIATLDPNPFVSGNGVKLLREAGIEVLYGLCEEEANDLNAIYFKYIKTGLPYIHIKFAQSLDGKMATKSGDSKWISNEEARTEVHHLRAQYDSIMVGRNTVGVDNPELTARENFGLGKVLKTPRRLIIGNPAKMDLSKKVFSDGHSHHTIVFCSDEEKIQFLNSHKEEILSKLVHFKIMTYDKKCGNLQEIFQKIVKEGIYSVFVEGGPKLIEELINQKLYDRITVYIAPMIVGNGVSYFENKKTQFIKDAIKFNKLKVKSLSNQAVFDFFREDI